MIKRIEFLPLKRWFVTLFLDKTEENKRRYFDEFQISAKGKNSLANAIFNTEKIYSDYEAFLSDTFD